MVSTKTSKKAPVKKDAKKKGFSLVKSRAGNNIIKLQKGFLMKCGHSIKKFADVYSVNLDFDDKSLTLNLDYGKVSPKDNDFMPTGDNWEMWYGDDSISTKYEDIDIVVEAYMFVKPYSVDNDNRKRKYGETSTIEVGDFYFEGTNNRMDRFREVFPELNGVSDDNVVEMQEWFDFNSMVDENNTAIQSIRVTGKLKFYVYDNLNGSLTKIHTHALNSSSDFFNSVEEFLVFLEANSHDAWWSALGKFDEFIISNGIATVDEPVGYSASARKSKKVKKNASDFDGRIYDILCAAENEPQQTADDGYLTILDGVPNDVLDQALSYAEGVYGIGYSASARKSKPVVKSKSVVKARPINKQMVSRVRPIVRARPIVKARPVKKATTPVVKKRQQPRSAW